MADGRGPGYCTVASVIRGMGDTGRQACACVCVCVYVCRHMDVDQLLCRRSLRPQEIVTIMQHTVLALQDLAVARMVHADVKPPNVLVR